MDDEQGLLFVESITNLNKKQTAYNFTVADFHTYYVTEHNVLVHNCDGKAGDSNALVPKNTTPKSTQKMEDPRNLIPTQDRSEMTGSRVKKFAKEMKRDGFDNFKPIDATRNARGRLEIEDGHHRTEAAKKAGLDKIPVNIWE